MSQYVHEFLARVKMESQYEDPTDARNSLAITLQDLTNAVPNMYSVEPAGKDAVAVTSDDRRIAEQFLWALSDMGLPLSATRAPSEKVEALASAIRDIRRVCGLGDK